MSFIIHQAIFGDSQGAYSLLDSSLDADTAKHICNVTDLLDRPYSGHLNEPIYRGFAFNDYYLFIKTFPDTDPGVRSGRVLSHVLIVDLKDLVLCDDLGFIFESFTQSADKGYKVSAIDYVSQPSNVSLNIKSGTRAASVISNFIHSDHIVWIGEESYIETLISLWHGFPSTLRCRLKFGAAYEPKNLNEEFINFHYILEKDESKWENSVCSLISKNSVGIIDTQATYYLVGDAENAKELITTLNVFNISITMLEDLDALVILSNTYSNLSNTSFNKLISLCDLISKYCPDNKKANDEKSHILNCLAEKINCAEPKEILGLKNPDWSGFRKVTPILSKVLTNRLENIVINNGLQSTASQIIILALSEDTTTTWWVNAVTNSLSTIFKSWRPDYAQTIWRWLMADEKILIRLGLYIPDSVTTEKILIKAWKKPSKKLAAELQIFSKKRNWYELHALSILRLYSAEEALKLQLKIDKNVKYVTAIKVISDEIDGDIFLPIAIESSDRRLIPLAALKIKKQPSLLDDFTVSNSNWVKVCIECIKSGIDIWPHINSKYFLVYKLFDEIIDGLIINQNVYNLLNESELNDLSEYPQRALIWSYLSSNDRYNLLNATTIGCIKLVDQNIIELASLESEITNTIINDDFIKKIISDDSVNTFTKTSLFKHFVDLNESNCLEFINQCEFTTHESGQLGDLILERKWKKAAKLCKDLDKEQHRSDLSIASQKTKSLLKITSVFEGLKDFLNWNDDDFERLEEKKFQVALSFSGEKRTYVKGVAEYLVEQLGKNSVFYDNNFKYLISQPNADTILQKIYRDNSELIVVFLCAEYKQKQWCGLEWRSIRDIIKNKDGQKIMLVRFDDEDIEGIFSIDGYIDALSHDEEEVSKMILQRLGVLIKASNEK